MDEPLAEQAAYYRERAGEYDDWWVRRGSYALPPKQQARWMSDVAQAEQALDEFAPTGRVLELACGTGLWTRRLVGHADSLTAVDSSPEVIELNRARLPGAGVEYLVDDLFTWTPPTGYDAVVFTYWLSHVPDGRLDRFWQSVRMALKPGGRVFLVDSAAYPPGSPYVRGGHPESRVLADGRSSTVMKRYWRPDELEQDLAARGLAGHARLTGHRMILYASISL